MYVHVHVETLTEYASGSVLRRIGCERCHTEYFYELARVAKGTGSAVYGIGKEAARQRAKKSAEKKLAKMLLNDGEAVACPKCKWLQSGMVRELRAHRHRWMRQLEYLCGGVAFLILLIYLMFCLTDPRIAENIARKMTTPAIVLVVLAIALRMLRGPLAGGFDPNNSRADSGVARGSGTPPALLRDSAGQFFAPEPECCTDGQAKSVTVQLARAAGSVPRQCCMCLGHADKWRKPAFCDTGLLAIPICKPCLRAWNWKTAKAVLLVIAGSALIAWLGAMLIPDLKQAERIGLGIGATVVLSAVLGLIAARRAKQPFRGKRIDKRRGVVKLTFLNQRYADALAEQYRSRLPHPHARLTSS
jgi:hypothetical protein